MDRHLGCHTHLITCAAPHTQLASWLAALLLCPQAGCCSADNSMQHSPSMLSQPCTLTPVHPDFVPAHSFLHLPRCVTCREATQTAAPRYTTRRTGITFYLSTTPASFADAELGCQRSGGHLAAYSTFAEQKVKPQPHCTTNLPCSSRSDVAGIPPTCK
jgi:hypothetical protein